MAGGTDASGSGTDAAGDLIKRKEMNIRDYLSMPDIEALFDAFIENTGIEETTDSVNKAFVYFNGGGEKDFSENRRVAQSLFEMASSH